MRGCFVGGALVLFFGCGEGMFERSRFDNFAAFGAMGQLLTEIDTDEYREVLIGAQRLDNPCPVITGRMDIAGGFPMSYSVLTTGSFGASLKRKKVFDRNWRVVAILTRDPELATYRAIKQHAPVSYTEYLTLEEVSCDVTASEKCLYGRFEDVEVIFDGKETWPQDGCMEPISE